MHSRMIQHEGQYKIAKWATRALGGLLTLIILVMLIAPMFISSDTLKAQLVAQVKKTTGRTLSIKGETSVRFFPHIAVTASDVTLSNPEGFTTPYFAHLDKLSTGAALKPLLQGELIITGITLNGPSINLETLAGGKKNWEFTADKVQNAAEKEAEAAHAQPKSNSPIKRFALGDITITNGMINWLQPKAKALTVSNIDATLQGADALEPLGLDATAEYQGDEVSLSVDVAKPKEFLNGETSAMAASVKLPGASLDFNGEGRMNTAFEAEGKLDMSAAALPKVLAWATGQAQNDALPQQVAVQGDLHYTPNTMHLKNATLRADGLSATGNLALALGGARPAVSGNLKTGTLNLDDLLGKGGHADHPAASGTSSGGGKASEGWSTKPIDLSGLKAADVDLGLALDGLRSGELELGQTATHITIAGGKLNLAVEQMQLYQGTAHGVLRASPQGIGADLAVDNVAIEPLIEALADKSRLQGIANLTLNVTGSGNSMRDWMESLGGNGKLMVRDGALKGINIGRFLRDAKQGFLFKSESESTDFSELSASFTIAQGVLNNKDLAMKSPALRVAGSGSANLGAKTVHYRLLPTIAGTSKGQGGKADVAGITIPLVITGAWSNPSVTPDLAGLVEEGIKDPAKLKENLKGAKELLKDYNSTDDLKRALLGDKAAEKPATASTTTEPAATSTTTEAAPKSKKEQREELIQQGIGGLLKGL